MRRQAGWFVLVKDAAGVVHAPHPRQPRRSGRCSCASSRSATLDNSATLQSALGQLYYVNLPQARRCARGRSPRLPLRRRALIPVNGRTYALTPRHDAVLAHGEQRLKGRAGAHYVIEHAGGTFEYLLDGFGWDSEIQSAGDIDRDGRPDFIVYVNGNNSRHVVRAAVEPGEAGDERAERRSLDARTGC